MFYTTSLLIKHRIKRTWHSVLHGMNIHRAPADTRLPSVPHFRVPWGTTHFVSLGQVSQIHIVNSWFKRSQKGWKQV